MTQWKMPPLPASELVVEGCSLPQWRKLTVVTGAGWGARLWPPRPALEKVPTLARRNKQVYLGSRVMPLLHQVSNRPDVLLLPEASVANVFSSGDLLGVASQEKPPSFTPSDGQEVSQGVPSSRAAGTQTMTPAPGQNRSDAPGPEVSLDLLESSLMTGQVLRTFTNFSTDS